MPPKRKRQDGGSCTHPTAAPSARATRSSTRMSNDGMAPEDALTSHTRAAKNSAKKNVSASSTRTPNASASAEMDTDLQDITEDEPPPKKTKSKAKTKPAPKAKAIGAKDIKTFTHDEPEKRSKLHDEDQAGTSKYDTRPAAPLEPYTPARALALFATYADADDADVIGPEGFERLCSDAAIPLEGALPLVLAWQLDAQEMGKFTKAEWVKAMDELQIASLPLLSLALKDVEDLLIFGKIPVEPSRASSLAKRRATGGRDQPIIGPYQRDRYSLYALDRKSAFLKLYMYCFTLAKPPQARNIDMETATAFWSVLLVPQYPIMSDIIDFINEKGTYKGTNKDLWSMMHEFCQTVSPSLDNYETDGAWPTLLDDFVGWKKSKMGTEDSSGAVTTNTDS